MISVKDKTRPIRVSVAWIALGVAFGSFTASLERLSAQDQQAFGTVRSSNRMADGKPWTVHNLDVNTALSYCYADAALNCRRYGRLYRWESARRVCRSLGDGWRLPTDDEWRQMAKHYGGVSEDSDDKGKAAYKALLGEGSSGFNALLGGYRPDDAQYARMEAHGFYWRHQRVIRPVDGSTILPEAGKASVVKAVARSSGPFPLGVSGTDPAEYAAGETGTASGFPSALNLPPCGRPTFSDSGYGLSWPAYPAATMLLWTASIA